jgi:hypothetical protein
MRRYCRREKMRDAICPPEPLREGRHDSQWLQVDSISEDSGRGGQLLRDQVLPPITTSRTGANDAPWFYGDGNQSFVVSSQKPTESVSSSPASNSTSVAMSESTTGS